MAQNEVYPYFILEVDEEQGEGLNCYETVLSEQKREDADSVVLAKEAALRGDYSNRFSCESLFR